MTSTMNSTNSDPESAEEAIKRIKFHAQRKFPQGVQALPLPPIKKDGNEDKEPSALPDECTSVQIESSNPEPPPVLTVRRPPTEDFLTFLCFRRTSFLPPNLDFFNKAPSYLDEKSENTEDNASKCINMNLKNGVACKPAKCKNKKKVENKFTKSKTALRKIRKNKSISCLKLTSKVKNKRLKSTKANIRLKKWCTRKELKLKETSKNSTRRDILKCARNTAARNRDCILTRNWTLIKKEAVKSKTDKNRKVSNLNSSFRKKVLNSKKGLRSGSSSTPQTETVNLKPKQSRVKRETEENRSGPPKRNSELSTNLRQKRRACKQDTVNDETPPPAKNARLKENVLEDKNVSTSKPVENGPSRPSRRTKEAAALFMEMLGKDFCCPEKLKNKDDDDDTISIESFPELPSARKNEQLEKEIKELAKMNAASSKNNSETNAAVASSKISKKRNTALNEKVKNSVKTKNKKSKEIRNSKIAKQKLSSKNKQAIRKKLLRRKARSKLNKRKNGKEREKLKASAKASSDVSITTSTELNKFPVKTIKPLLTWQETFLKSVAETVKAGRRSESRLCTLASENPTILTSENASKPRNKHLVDSRKKCSKNNEKELIQKIISKDSNCKEPEGQSKSKVKKNISSLSKASLAVAKTSVSGVKNSFVDVKMCSSSGKNKTVDVKLSATRVKNSTIDVETNTFIGKSSTADMKASTSKGKNNTIGVEACTTSGKNNTNDMKTSLSDLKNSPMNVRTPNGKSSSVGIKTSSSSEKDNSVDMKTNTSKEKSSIFLVKTSTSTSNRKTVEKKREESEDFNKKAKFQNDVQKKSSIGKTKTMTQRFSDPTLKPFKVLKDNLKGSKKTCIDQSLPVESVINSNVNKCTKKTVIQNLDAEKSIDCVEETNIRQRRKSKNETLTASAVVKKDADFFSVKSTVQQGEESFSFTESISDSNETFSNDKVLRSANNLTPNVAEASSNFLLKSSQSTTLVKLDVAPEAEPKRKLESEASKTFEVLTACPPKPNQNLIQTVPPLPKILDKILTKKTVLKSQVCLRNKRLKKKLLSSNIINPKGLNDPGVETTANINSLTEKLSKNKSKATENNSVAKPKSVGLKSVEVCTFKSYDDLFNEMTANFNSVLGGNQLPDPKISVSPESIKSDDGFVGKNIFSSPECVINLIKDSSYLKLENTLPSIDELEPANDEIKNGFAESPIVVIDYKSNSRKTRQSKDETEICASKLLSSEVTMDESVADEKSKSSRKDCVVSSSKVKIAEAETLKTISSLKLRSRKDEPPQNPDSKSVVSDESKLNDKTRVQKELKNESLATKIKAFNHHKSDKIKPRCKVEPQKEVSCKSSNSIEEELVEAKVNRITRARKEENKLDNSEAVLRGSEPEKTEVSDGLKASKDGNSELPVSESAQTIKNKWDSSLRSQKKENDEVLGSEAKTNETESWPEPKPQKEEKSDIFEFKEDALPTETEKYNLNLKSKSRKEENSGPSTKKLEVEVQSRKSGTISKSKLRMKNHESLEFEAKVIDAEAIGNRSVRKPRPSKEKVDEVKDLKKKNPNLEVFQTENNSEVKPPKGENLEVPHSDSEVLENEAVKDQNDSKFRLQDEASDESSSKKKATRTRAPKNQVDPKIEHLKDLHIEPSDSKKRASEMEGLASQDDFKTRFQRGSGFKLNNSKLKEVETEEIIRKISSSSKSIVCIDKSETEILNPEEGEVPLEGKATLTSKAVSRSSVRLRSSTVENSSEDSLSPKPPLHSGKPHTNSKFPKLDQNSLKVPSLPKSNVRNELLKSPAFVSPNSTKHTLNSSPNTCIVELNFEKQNYTARTPRSCLSSVQEPSSSMVKKKSLIGPPTSETIIDKCNESNNPLTKEKSLISSIQGKSKIIEFCNPLTKEKSPVLSSEKKIDKSLPLDKTNEIRKELWSNLPEAIISIPKIPLDRNLWVKKHAGLIKSPLIIADQVNQEQTLTEKEKPQPNNVALPSNSAESVHREEKESKFGRKSKTITNIKGVQAARTSSTKKDELNSQTSFQNTKKNEKTYDSKPTASNSISNLSESKIPINEKNLESKDEIPCTMEKGSKKNESGLSKKSLSSHCVVSEVNFSKNQNHLTIPVSVLGNSIKADSLNFKSKEIKPCQVHISPISVEDPINKLANKTKISANPKLIRVKPVIDESKGHSKSNCCVEKVIPFLDNEGKTLLNTDKESNIPVEKEPSHSKSDKNICKSAKSNTKGMISTLDTKSHEGKLSMDKKIKLGENTSGAKFPDGLMRCAELTGKESDSVDRKVLNPLKEKSDSPANPRNLSDIKSKEPGEKVSVDSNQQHGSKGNLKENKVKTSRSNSTVAVQVSSEKEAVIECSTQADTEEEDETLEMRMSEGQLFYIPLQQAASVSSQIQGVAVKLNTEGPDQRVIMRAKLVTKPLPEFSEQSIASSSVNKPLSAVVPGKRKLRPLGPSNVDKCAPVGTVLPTSRTLTNDKSNTLSEEKDSDRMMGISTLLSSAIDCLNTKSTEKLEKPFTKTTLQIDPNSSFVYKIASTANVNSDLKLMKNSKHKFENKLVKSEESKVKAQPKKTTSAVTHSASTPASSVTKSAKRIKHETQSNSSPSELDSKAGIFEAPSFYPTEEQLEDPLCYIESIMPQAEKFGICRIVPPSSFKPDCKVTDDLRFVANIQYIHRMLNRWGISSKELAAIRKQLAAENISMKNPPSVGGTELDLPQLYHKVQSFGGLAKVVKYNYWLKIAEAFKIPKSVHDRSTKLYDIYCKYLLPYDNLSPDERNKLLSSVEKDWKHHKFGDDGFFSDFDKCIMKGQSMALSQFYRVGKNIMNTYFGGTGTENETGPDPKEVEEEYWKHVSEGDCHICVYAASIDTGPQGLGFPSASAKNCTFAKHPSNLKILTNNNYSVLRSLGPVIDLTVPTLHVGMLFSTFCWFKDPHGLPWIEYLHTGASKIWYGIPAERNLDFRKAMSKLQPSYKRSDQAVWLASDTVMIPPQLLVENGVSLSRVVQEPGQFIIVCPRSFTSSIATGYLLSESVFFALPSWLKTAHKIFEDLQKSCEPSVFSLERLLCCIVLDSRSSVDVLIQVGPLINEMRDREVALRSQLGDLGLRNGERLEHSAHQSRADNEPIHECEVCCSNLFLSYVINTNTEEFYCLSHAIEILMKKRQPLKHFKLFFVYTEKELDDLVKKLNTRIEAKQTKKAVKK